MSSTFRAVKSAIGSEPLSSVSLFTDPVRNKGTAFTSEERRKYYLEGLLPQAVETLDRQLERVMGPRRENHRPRTLCLSGGPRGP
jgi:hypothetical protein